MTKIDIFSGFLGAGKTTLIKKLLKEAYKGEQVVLIENAGAWTLTAIRHPENFWKMWRSARNRHWNTTLSRERFLSRRSGN